jgi:hypothetical protein
MSRGAQTWREPNLRAAGARFARRDRRTARKAERNAQPKPDSCGNGRKKLGRWGRVRRRMGEIQVTSGANGQEMWWWWWRMKVEVGGSEGREAGVHAGPCLFVLWRESVRGPVLCTARLTDALTAIIHAIHYGPLQRGPRSQRYIEVQVQPISSAPSPLALAGKLTIFPRDCVPSSLCVLLSHTGSVE